MIRYQENDKIRYYRFNRIYCRKTIIIVLNHLMELKIKFMANHTYNDAQIEWFKAGSALNLIRKSNQNN